MKLTKSLHKYYLNQRFFPGLFSIFINPFYFIRKPLVKQIRMYAKELNGRLLDFGCGTKPYLSLFSHMSEYIGVDVENEGHSHETEDIDVFYDGKTLSFEDGSFDSVLASEVLEHTPDIISSLSEIRRVLKMNGKILITVPFVWPEHELPYDFRRYTEAGIDKILSDNGFRTIAHNKIGTFFEVIIQLWMMYLHDLFYVKNKYTNLLINFIFISPFCLIGLLFSLIFPKRKSLYFGSVILAEKIK